MSAPLLDADFVRKLETLAVTARRSSSSFKGEHASTRHGPSVEFADYRNYTAGDDFRHIDWNAFGRLEKLFIRLFREETELSVYILLDRSDSMQALPGKLDHAKKLAAALTYISLCNFDRVMLSSVQAQHGPVRGKGQALACFRFLEPLPAAGAVDLNAWLKAFGTVSHRPGLVIVISDFLQESDPLVGLKFLTHRRHEVFALQVLHEEEVRPSWSGDLELVDVETAYRREVTVTSSVLSSYRRAVEQYRADFEERCIRYGFGYAFTLTSDAVEDVILRTLRRQRLLT